MEFELSIDYEKFRSTNAVWNELRLNDPWSVGYVTTLIELDQFESKEQWESFYYKSGEKREELILKLKTEEHSLLNDNSLLLSKPYEVKNLDWRLKSLNTQFGRTKEQLYSKGELLYQEVKNNGKQLSIQDCFECVRYRVICETWNGIIVRERNTINTLSKRFPTTEFRKVTGETDHKYAVDYELYRFGKLIAAVQIKPKSYLGKAAYINKARAANQRKNALYLKKNGSQVYDIISNTKGEIFNKEILRELESL